uniref:CWH43-like N-terminal domain-containing protein n=1 Tax=Panagrolaimus superbus TaxID=310955 RepID=A0A914Z746_9BILA
MAESPQKVQSELQKGSVSFINGNSRFIELFKLTPTPVFLLGFLPPLSGAILSIAIALIFHNAEISNYNWQCGRARFPSLSRIINLPLERTIWQILIFSHIPIRVLEVFAGFIRFRRLFNVNIENQKSKRFYEFCRYIYLFVGLGEIFFLGALSIIGERENIKIHVIMFYLFGFCGIIFFISTTYCHRQSLYYIKPYGILSYRLKMFFMCCYIAAMPILVTAFLLYWKKCITLGYDIFAICEYLGVLFNIGFHGVTYFDVKDRLVLSIRMVEPLESSSTHEEEEETSS